MNRSTLRIAGVIAGAIAVTAVAAAAVTAAVMGDDSTLSPTDVDQLLAGVTTSATATTTASEPVPRSSAVGDRNVATLLPGTVTVSCDGNLATLQSWSPNPGYRADDPVRGPAVEVSIRFENDGSDADYKVTAVCGIDGFPTISLGPDDHSGRGRD